MQPPWNQPAPYNPQLAESEREADLYELKLHQQGMVRYLVMGGVFIVLGGAVCIFSFYLAAAVVAGALFVAKGIAHHSKANALKTRLGIR